MQNNDLWTGITSLYESKIQPVILCMQNSVICTRITILYEFQPSSVFFFQAKQRLYDQTYKLHGSQTSPVVLCMQNNMISNRNTSLHGSQSSSVVFAYKTATFGSELQVSMGPRLHLLICDCKTGWLEPE